MRDDGLTFKGDSQHDHNRLTNAQIKAVQIGCFLINLAKGL